MPINENPKNFGSSSKQNINLSPTKRYVIAQREPWSLPDSSHEIPSPKQNPGPIPTINLLTTILPPALMAIGMVVVPLVMGTAKAVAIIPMALVGIGAPLASLIGYNSQKKKYKEALINREKAYRSTLDQERANLNKLLSEQRNILEREYPSAVEVAKIGVNQTKRLWWRRSMDSDFLSLRIGSGQGVPSFKIIPPRISDPNEPLLPMGLAVVQEYQTHPGIPLLLNLGNVGSVAIASKTSNTAYNLARRFLLDLLVHHSPQDVNVAVLANTRDAESRWGWLRWAPHTAALNTNEKPRRINFTDEQFDQYLRWLIDEFNSRIKQSTNLGGLGNRKSTRTAIVVFLDDNGIARQMPEICSIAQNGYEVGIYLFFVGGQNWPRECRSRFDISGADDFEYVETWDAGGKALRFSGKIETASIELCESVTRSLAGLEVIGGAGSVQLPESIRLSAVLNPTSLETDTIKNSWSSNLQPEGMLQFPIGVTTNRDQLEPIEINLLPESKGGVDAYHTILIGTTGSGKSEFMKSMVMGAALRYPPNLLNFFFLDFKGGAAFNVFEQLPHVSGIVTNLKPELVDRGLESIRSEIDRRQTRFSLAQVQNIWAYNQQKPENQMPQLVLLLDEFARGLNDFPKLRETLDLLVRQGRSLGMYLILANQDSNAEVDKLLNNVGWRIALKVGKDEEISMIDRTLMNESGKLPRRAGEGYLRSIKAVITRFQAGYAGLPVVTTETQDLEEFTIFSMENNGVLTKFYKNKSEAQKEDSDRRVTVVTEEEKIITNIKEATREMGIKPVPRIYLDPMPEILDLSEVISDSDVKVKFENNEWTLDTLTRGQIIVPIGYYDSPSECIQDVLKIDFSQQDGHLWVVGAPGSGKAMTLTSMILSLALTYTPEEIQIYVLEFGSGSMRALESLPHIGSVIRLQEKERIQRLLAFIDAEMEKRTSHDTQYEVSHLKQKDIFLFINSFAEMRTTYPDEADRISRYVRDGKSAGIHLVITTNRGAELTRSIASNIARKLVLQLASKDEYMDVVGKNVSPIAVHSQGRGYWVSDRVYECQIACPNSINIKTLTKEMDEKWIGTRPVEMGIIPTCISLSTMLEKIPNRQKGKWTQLPIGISYETLEVVQADLSREMGQWLIIGPRESGKSNFLFCTIKNLLENGGGKWEIYTFTLRRSPLTDFKSDYANFHFANSNDTVGELLNAFSEKLKATPENIDTRHLLIIDDLGAIFEPGRETITTALNTLLPVISARQDVHIMGAGLIDELRNQVGTPLLKSLKQSRTGIVFSKDAGELDWLGAVLPLEFRKFEMPIGRGFFVSKGKLTYLQTPFQGQCRGKESTD